MAIPTTIGDSLNDYICAMMYKYKKAQEGAEVNGDPKVTKESVLADTKKRFSEEFPDVEIPEKELEAYSIIYLMSGLKPETLDEMVEKERKRQMKMAKSGEKAMYGMKVKKKS